MNWARSLATSDGLRDIASRVMNLPFYRALAFTLTYCFIVTPLAMALGFAIALAVNTLPKLLKGPAIFFSILPMIITPLVGSLILAWMFNPAGIFGAALQSSDRRPDAVAARVARADVDCDPDLWRLDQWAVFLCRLLRRSANRAARHVGIAQRSTVQTAGKPRAM